jgi:hypothetical protein
MSSIFNPLPTTKKQAERMISTAEFKDMDDMDWEAFQGVDDEFAQICYAGDLVVIQTTTDTIFIQSDEDGLTHEVRFSELP